MPKSLNPEPKFPRPSPRDIKINAGLGSLGATRMEQLAAESVLIHLNVDDQIYRSNDLITEVFFPVDCVLSVVSRMQDGNMIEVGTIGREGNSAIPLLLGATTTANECYCQVPGNAIKIDLPLFNELRTEPAFTKMLDRFLQSYVNMLGQLAACNRLHNVYERCARWLLMTHDRVGLTEFHLTHEYLAMMLGTQRSGVTIAAATLQKAGFIRYGRGIIAITDRPGLENAACECYEVARQQFAGILQAERPAAYR